jgi:acyl-CoA synthetase (AMP-forming)/AMP-acid ligase II
VAARCRRFQRLGLRRGDRVFLHFGNRIEFFAELLAVWRLGACAIPLDSRLTAHEVEILGRSVRPRIAVVDDETDADVAARAATVAERVIDTLEVDAGGDGEAPAGIARLDDDALILFTSGSTGSPKGVLHTHRSLRARWITLRQSLGLRAYRRTLCILPTHFGHGLICNCLFPWLSGQDLYLTPPFKSDLIMRLGRLIDEHGITFVSSVPSIWRMALKLAKPPQGGTLERVHCGSAPLSGGMWKDIQRWSGTKSVANAYGITETGSWVAGLTTSDFEPEDGLIGEPWGAVVRILNSREPRAPLDPGEPVRGRRLGLRVAQHARADEGLLRARRPHRPGGVPRLVPDRRHRARRRARPALPARSRARRDQQGRRQDLSGRRRRGRGAVRGATDVCTFALDDPIYGQNVGMAVALSDRGDASVRALHAWMKERLAEPKMPVKWFVVEAIPRTSRGKINRDVVKETCAGLAPLDLAGILRGEGAS